MVVSGGKFTVPGVCMIKTRHKPATTACKKEIFGRIQTVKAKPARTIVKPRGRVPDPGAPLASENTAPHGRDAAPSLHQKAPGLMLAMQRQALSPDVITFRAANRACEKGSLPHKALGPMAVMQRQALSPDVITFNAASSAYEKGNQPHKALSLLVWMRRQA